MFSYGHPTRNTHLPQQVLQLVHAEHQALDQLCLLPVLSRQPLQVQGARSARATSVSHNQRSHMCIMCGPVWKIHVQCYRPCAPTLRLGAVDRYPALGDWCMAMLACGHVAARNARQTHTSRSLRAVSRMCCRSMCSTRFLSLSLRTWQDVCMVCAAKCEALLLCGTAVAQHPLCTLLPKLLRRVYSAVMNCNEQQQ